MTDFEAVVQRYYGDRPVLQRIDDALRTGGVDPGGLVRPPAGQLPRVPFDHRPRQQRRAWPLLSP